MHTLNAGGYIVRSGANVSVEKNWPYTGWFLGFVVVFRHDNIFPNDHGSIICINESTNNVYRQTHAYETWSEWKEESTATPPQVYNLPLASQIPSSQSYTNCYYKTQDNIVHVSFRIAHNDKFQKSEVFATLPVGYRPGYTIARCVAGDGIIDYGSGIVAAEIQIYRDGNIMLFHCNSDVKWLLGEFSFVAEN